MSELKTKPTAESFEAFLDRAVAPVRHADCRTVAAMMEKATSEKPVMWGTIVGFGRYRYTYDSGHGGEWPLIGFSPRKKDLTLYITPGVDQFPELLERLGRFKTGKSCLYLRSLEDVDLTVLERLVQETLERAFTQLAQTPEATLDEARAVGRQQLPSTVRGLLFHAAEHGARHAGQAITTMKIVRSS